MARTRTCWRAGAEDADMIIAVTNSDETNMVACQVAYTLFHTPTKIARVRAPGFLEQDKLFGPMRCPSTCASARSSRSPTTSCA
jgi:Trk K+ transport system NAD-binding subunit